jgi:hypothetical protein
VPSDFFSFSRLAEEKWDGTESVPPLGKPMQMPFVSSILRPLIQLRRVEPANRAFLQFE